ncbi:MAG: protease [Acidobacteria bacterium]|nr:protease [Acidobacteriota bacterium]
MPNPRARGSRRTAQPAEASTGAVTPLTGEFTGKYLVLLPEDCGKSSLEAIKQASGLKTACSAADFTGAAVSMSQAEGAEVLYLDKLNVAVVDSDPSQVGGLESAAASDSKILAVEPERIIYTLGGGLDEQSLQYLRGYKDAVNHLYETLATREGEASLEDEDVMAAMLANTAQFTLGLRATLVNRSRFAGRGIRVAVLDTGFDLNHPDYPGRVVSSQSFINGQAVDDLNGHGTHCIGSALGPQRPVTGVRRYGCAFAAEIFAGKVLSNAGSGGDTGILVGINWAITNKCRVIPMSLGAPVQVGEGPSPIYENVAQRTLRSNPGKLIIAAAGNDSSRPGQIAPVSRPANCPSIMAVAAVDSNFGIAQFSNGRRNPNGGGVDIAGPGVAVFSSAPDPFPASVQPTGPGRPWPPRHHTISGTSMATPHVAGIAAMWLESRGVNTPATALWQLLTGNARRLNLPSRDVGAGLVQAPI